MLPAQDNTAPPPGDLAAPPATGPATGSRAALRQPDVRRGSADEATLHGDVEKGAQEGEQEQPEKLVPSDELPGLSEVSLSSGQPALPLALQCLKDAVGGAARRGGLTGLAWLWCGAGAGRRGCDHSRLAGGGRSCLPAQLESRKAAGDREFCLPKAQCAWLGRQR